MFTLTMSTKGQFTLPKKVREDLKLHAGCRVSGVVDDDGRVILTPTLLSPKEFLARRPPWPKGRRPATLADMKAAIAKGATRGRF